MKVNGVDVTLDSPITLQSLLEREGFDIGRIAVERNGEIVSRSRYETELLDADDKLEVITFVGGG